VCYQLHRETLAVAIALGDDDYTFISERSSLDAPRKTGWFEYAIILITRLLDWNLGEIHRRRRRCDDSSVAKGGGVEQPSPEDKVEFFSMQTKNSHTQWSEQCRELGDDKHQPEW